MSADIAASHALWTIEPLELDADELLWLAVYGIASEAGAAGDELARRASSAAF